MSFFLCVSLSLYVSVSVSVPLCLSLSLCVCVCNYRIRRQEAAFSLSKRAGFRVRPPHITYTWQPWHVLCGFALLAIKCHLNPAKSAKRIPLLTRRCQRKTINIAVCNNNLLFLVRRCPPRATSSPHACNHWRGQGTMAGTGVVELGGFLA